jgi:hypothetical protein
MRGTVKVLNPLGNWRGDMPMKCWRKHKPRRLYEYSVGNQLYWLPVE